MKLIRISLILLMAILPPQVIIAAPRPVDEDTSSFLSPGVALVLAIIFTIIMAIGYFKLKDENGDRDSGCGGLLLLAILAVVLGIIALK